MFYDGWSSVYFIFKALMFLKKLKNLHELREANRNVTSTLMSPSSTPPLRLLPPRSPRFLCLHLFSTMAANVGQYLQISSNQLKTGDLLI